MTDPTLGPVVPTGGPATSAPQNPRDVLRTGGTAMPAQLPAPPPLSGRATEIRVLDAALAAREATQAASTLVVITGPAGIGKTALAQSWASGVANQFPDGQLYASLRDVPARDVLRAFLHAVGVRPRLVPAAPHEQATLYSALLADQAVLVVLDDVADAADAELLRTTSARGLTVVTTRRRRMRTSADSVVRLTLPRLSTADSGVILAQHCGNRLFDDPTGAARVARLAGGHPLALRLTAGYVTADPAITWDAAADHLDTPGLAEPMPDDDTVLDRALTMALSETLPMVVDLLAMLSLHNGPHTTAWIAASAAADDPEVAQSCLDDAVHRGLLLRDGHRYLFPTAVRGWLRHLRGSVDTHAARAAAMERMIAATYREAAGFNQALRPHADPAGAHDLDTERGEPTANEAIAWFEREMPNLLAAQRHAEQINRPALVAQLAEAVGAYFERQHPSSTAWIAVMQRGVLAACRCHDAAAEIRLRCQLAAARLAAGQLGNARFHAQDAVRTAVLAGDPALRAAALATLGAVELAHLRPEQAVWLLRGAVHAEARARNWRGAAVALRGLAEALSTQDHRHAAVRALRGAARMLRHHGTHADQAECATDLARTLLAIGDLAAATVELDAALVAATASQSPCLLDQVLLAQAERAHQAGDLAAARQLATRALPGLLEHGDPAAIARMTVLLTTEDR